MQLVGDLAPLLLLHGDELTVEPAVLVARGVERARQRVEALGDDGKLLDLGQPESRRVMAVLEAQHASGEMGERIEHAAEHHIKDAEGQRIEHKPHNGEGREIMPSFCNLVGRLADNRDRGRMIDGDHPHRAANELRPNEPCEPARRLGVAGAIDGRRLRRYDSKLAARVHEHDADMAEMLELQGQLLIELAQAFLRGEVLHGGGDETLRHFERSLDLDPGRRPRVKDRHGAAENRREEIDHPHGDEKLRPYRPVIPKLLQHAPIVSTTNALRSILLGECRSIAIYVDRFLALENWTSCRTGRSSKGNRGNRIAKLSRTLLGSWLETPVSTSN